MVNRGKNHPDQNSNSQGELLQELEAIINSSYDGMFITDGDGRVIRVNKAYERITGVVASEVMDCLMKELVQRGYYDQSVTLLVMAQKKTVTIMQTIRNNRRVLATGNPVYAEDGSLFRVVTNIRDITELVQLQGQLEKTTAEKQKYEQEISHLRSLQVGDEDFITRSPQMLRLLAMAGKVAHVNSTVLICGESGTGKEIIAKWIHKLGKGEERPFIKINCGAIPEQLLESELFGYEGGAFTGARREGKPGLFELAHKGTLFLDEVGDLPLLLQVKLLRAIQEKEIIRVGGIRSIAVDTRIIAATHRDLKQMVNDGTFREDLFYRLMVVPIHLPPLRERKEDIPALINYFLQHFNRRFDFHRRLHPAVMDRLQQYNWPGNVRELENLMERLAVTAVGDEITPECLPEGLGQKILLPSKDTKLKDAVAEVEKYLLRETYRDCRSWPKVAERLGVDRATVFRKVRRYQL